MSETRGEHFPAVVETSQERVALAGCVSLPKRFKVTEVVDWATTPYVVVELETTDDGALRCRAVHVVSTPAGRDVLDADLRRVDIEGLTEAAATLVGGEDVPASAVEELMAEVQAAAEGDEDSLRALAERWLEDAKQQRVILRTTRHARRDARRKITDDLLREVARVYSENPAAPTRAVADAFGVSHRTAGYYVARARKADLLPPVGGDQ